MAQNTAAAMQVDRPDYQARGAEAVRVLNDTLTELFVAEDQLEPSFGGETTASQDQGGAFVRSIHGDSAFVLSPQSLSKLDSAVSKVIKSKKLADVDMEVLLRAQKLCHNVILQALEVDSAVPEDAGSADAIQTWVIDLFCIDAAMVASQIVLKIMTARREDRELCSEELLGDLLNVFRPAVENTVIPIVEMKATSEPGRTFKGTSDVSNTLGSLIHRTPRALRCLGELLRHVEPSETTYTQVEDLCMKLVFVTNSSSEKESIIGIQRFESFRRLAMDVIAIIFLRKPDQRKSILGETLTSLEKLPVARQSARQFKMEGRKPIQLVSALLMQLVQTAATLRQTKRRRFEAKREESEEESDMDNDSESESDDERPSPRKTKGSALERLTNISTELLQLVSWNARYICNYLVSRALNSSKSGDEPYRNLLDIFTEDFANVLGTAEWPAAELLLQQLLREMLNIMNKKEFGAPAKNMALDIMGVMGSGIADLRQHLEKVSHSLEADAMSERLQLTVKAYFDGDDVNKQLLSLDGSFRIAIDALDLRCSDDLQLQQARNYLLLQWASAWTRAAGEDSTAAESKHDLVAEWLAAALEGPRHISETSDDIEKVSTACARVASDLVAVNMTFCRANPRIFQTLVQSMNSNHATVRSRALKSVYQFMEKDPSVLSGPSGIFRQIINAAQDNSTMVRDSALSLVGKALALKPELESRCMPLIIAWTSDTAVGIRRRALKLTKEIYERNTDEDVRVPAATAMLHRLSDSEENIRDLARSTFLELWITPYVKAAEPTASFDEKSELQRHASRLIAIADQSEEALRAFEPLFQGFLNDSAPSLASSRKVCKAIVASLFDSFIENEQQGAKSRQSILAFFSIFAQAGAHIFTYDQLKLLQPYTQNHKTHQDLRLFQKVAKIYNAALPALGSAQREFVESTQGKIITSITLVPPESFADLMDEATRCLWTTSTILNDDRKLVSMSTRVFSEIHRLKDSNDTKLPRYVFMAGYFGKNWDLEPRKAEFVKKFPTWKFSSVSDLLVQILSAVVSSKQPVTLQNASLHSLCLTCESNPSNYRSKVVNDLFNAVFQGGADELQHTLLVGLRDFFVKEEAKGRTDTEGQEPTGIENSAERLGKSMKSSDSDDAANRLAQTYLDPVLRLAKVKNEDTAFAAVETIATMNKQGVVVPRENISVLICLETSRFERVAKVAFEEHRRLNTKHESIVEKVYVLAFRDAWKYQRDVFGGTQGCEPDHHPKMRSFFTVLKESSLSVRKQFLSNICKQLRMPARERTTAELLEHVRFLQWTCENLATAEFARVDEVMAVMKGLEDIFAADGNPLSQEIEALQAGMASGQPLPFHEETLYRLAITAAGLNVIWHARVCMRDCTTNLPPVTRKAGGAPPASAGRGRPPKDSARDVTRPPNMSTSRPSVVDTFILRVAAFSLNCGMEIGGQIRGGKPLVENVDEQWTYVRRFMELYTLDHETRVSDGDDGVAVVDDDASTPGTPVPHDNDVSFGSGNGSGGQKRKRARSRSRSGSATSTPSKRKKARASLERRPSGLGVTTKSELEDAVGEVDGDFEAE